MKTEYTTKKSTEYIEQRLGHLGPISLLKVTMVSGRISWRVSNPGGITMFGNDEAAARRYYAIAQ
jgi:hypothetical protein